MATDTPNSEHRNVLDAKSINTEASGSKTTLEAYLVALEARVAALEAV